MVQGCGLPVIKFSIESSNRDIQRKRVQEFPYPGPALSLQSSRMKGSRYPLKSWTHIVGNNSFFQPQTFASDRVLPFCQASSWQYAANTQPRLVGHAPLSFFAPPRRCRTLMILQPGDYFFFCLAHKSVLSGAFAVGDGGVGADGDREGAEDDELWPKVGHGGALEVDGADYLVEIARRNGVG